MTESRSIAVVEPQMHNLFHSPFNAALLHAIVLGFPDARVSFSALPGHMFAVRSILKECAPEILARVEWREIEPSQGSSIPARWLSNRRILRNALRTQERIVFCSISRMQLLQLKRLVKSDENVLAVLHGDLGRILEPETERFPASLFALRRVLRMTRPRGLRYVLLGESIRRNIPREFAAEFADAVVIDHPYHFYPMPDMQDVGSSAPMTIGVFGNSGDGRLLEQVARSVKAVDPKIIFRVIGFVGDAGTVERLAPLVEGAGVEPISREEFLRRAESITYALWLAPVGSFQLRPSGTFFDALASSRPLVYVGNDFIDEYLGGADGIGVRCETAEDVAAELLRISRQHEVQAYLKARAAIREFRVRFAPETLAALLPSKFGW